MSPADLLQRLLEDRRRLRAEELLDECDDENLICQEQDRRDAEIDAIDAQLPELVERCGKCLPCETLLDLYDEVILDLIKRRKSTALYHQLHVVCRQAWRQKKYVC